MEVRMRLEIVGRVPNDAHGGRGNTRLASDLALLGKSVEVDLGTLLSGSVPLGCESVPVAYDEDHHTRGVPTRWEMPVHREQVLREQFGLGFGAYHCLIAVANEEVAEALAVALVEQEGWTRYI